MARLKTFEQFVSEMDRAEEIEKDIVDQGTPDAKGPEETEAEADKVQAANEAEAGLDAEDLDGKTKDVSGKIEFDDKAVNTDVQDLGKEVEKEIKDTPEDDEIGKEVSESEETEDAEKKTDVSDETENKTVAEKLKDCFEAMKNEAAVWEEDEYDEHTIETYMTETASLLGGQTANTLKSMKEEYALEAFEAACNSIKEAFCKKVDEVKEEEGAAAAEENEI